MNLKSKKIIFLFNESKNFNIRAHFAEIMLKQQALLTIIAKKSDDYSLENGYDFYPINFNRTGINIFKDIYVAIKLFILIKKIKPDLTVSFMVKPSILALASHFFYRKGKLLAIFTGLGFSFRSQTKLAKMIRFFIIPFLYITLRKRGNHLATLNDDDRAIMQRLTKLGNDKILLLESGEGVDIHQFKPRKKNPKHKTIIIVALMRLLYEKGIIELLKAGEILQKKGLDFCLNIYGEIDKNPNSLTLMQMKYYQKHHAANFLGFGNAQEIYNSANIVVLPSYHEGLPTCLLEAASCGLPIIATDIAGSRKICLDKKTGLLVPARDEIALATAMEKLILDRPKREIYGKAGYHHIHQNFTKKISATNFLQLIHKIIA